MINVNELTTQLRMLPDQALQRVAMMYKQDPYIFPMIISEGMARKKLRQAAQAQAAQPQPKVADQAVASLGYTPEEVGIGALQAPNMRGMADGGIAGYDEGALIAHNEPVVRMSDGGVARYQAGGQSVGVTPYGGIYGGQRLLPTTTGYEGMSIDEFLKAAYNDVSDVVKRLYDKVPKESLAQVVAEDLAKKKSQEAAQRPAAGGARSVGIGGPRVGEREAYEQQAAGQTPPAQGKPPAAPAAPAVASTPAAAGPGRAEQMLGETERAALRRLNQMKLDAERRGDEERIQYEAGKPKGEAFAGLEALLKKQEAAESGEREQAKGMAIFNAGLAMMAGGSPYALQNIAKGALAGTSEYAGALKDLKQAAKERVKLQADIEQARRAEARGDNETALKLVQRQNDRMDKLEEHMIDLGAKLGISKADVASKMEGLRLELGSRERIASAQLAQEPGDIRSLRAMAADPKLLETAAALQGAKGEGTLVRQLALQAVKDPTSLPLLKKQDQELYDLVMAEIGKLRSGTGAQASDRALVEKYLNKP